MTLYNARHSGDQFRITKFDADMNVESSYLCTTSECDCPAGQRQTCRHRQMLPRFLERNHIGDEWFFDFDRGGWVQMGDEWAQPPELTGLQEEQILMGFHNPPEVQVPERSKGSDCKSDASSHDGSNPSLHTSFMKRRFL